MCPGGGGTPQLPKDNSMQLAMMQRQWAKQDEKKAEKERLRKEGEFNEELGEAATGARTTGLNYLGERGLSSDSLGSVIDEIINNQRMKVPELDSNPAAYFGTDIFETGLNNYQNLKRGNNNAQVQSTFTPGFESTYIPDNSIDSIVNDILGERRATAQNQVDFQRKRGQLNDTGYNAAMGRLSEQESAARGTLGGIGMAELGRDRQSLMDIVANAGNAANSWSLGTPGFSVDPYKQQVSSRATQEIGNMRGDILSALGGTELFDVPSLIAAGGTAQGPQNLTTVDTVAPFNQRKNNKSRGLGSTGAF